MNTQAEILLNQVARRCNKEMIEAGIKNMEAHKLITDRYASMLKDVEISKIRMMCEIGIINGQIKER